METCAGCQKQFPSWKVKAVTWWNGRTSYACHDCYPTMHKWVQRLENAAKRRQQLTITPVQPEHGKISKFLPIDLAAVKAVSAQVN
jgi:hypothetical protein